MKIFRSRWLWTVLVLGLASWGSGEEATASKDVKEVVIPSNESATRAQESESRLPAVPDDADGVPSTWVDRELIRTSQLRYSKFSNVELNETLQRIGELRPEQRRSLLLEIQRRIRTDGHLAFVQGAERYGRGQGKNKNLEEIPSIEEVRLIATQSVAADDPESQAARERFLREQQKRANTKDSTIPTARAYKKD